MKKLASLVLAGAMAFSLAACGNNSTPAGGSSANAGHQHSSRQHSRLRRHRAH